jgi:transcriptional regulator with XRE-family HTH domain
MNERTQDPAVQRRRLRTELRGLRKAAGQTQKDVAVAMDWSPSKVIRIENGDVRITPTDLRGLLAHFGVHDEVEVARLVEMARIAKRDSWSEYREAHSPGWVTYLGYESSASLIRNFEPAFVPGLLQTEEYSGAVFATYGLAKDVADKRWEGRLRRQELHDLDAPPKMFFIIDEAVVRRAVGGVGVIRRQLRRLVDFSEQPHVVIQVVPFSAGAYPSMAEPFIVLEFPGGADDDFVYLDRPQGGTAVSDEVEATGLYVERFIDLEDLALSPDDSRRLLESLIDDEAAFTSPAGGEA